MVCDTLSTVFVMLGYPFCDILCGFGATGDAVRSKGGLKGDPVRSKVLKIDFSMILGPPLGTTFEASGGLGGPGTRL